METIWIFLIIYECCISSSIHQYLNRYFSIFLSKTKSMMKTFYWFMWCCFLHEYTLVYKHNRLYRAEQHKTWNDFIHLGRSRSRCRITFYLYPWHKLFRLNNIPSSQDILPCLSVWYIRKYVFFTLMIEKIDIWTTMI